MKTFAKTPLALAITALLAAPYALATNTGGGDSDNEFSTSAALDVTVENSIDVEVNHKVDNDIDVDLTLDATVHDPDHFSTATVDRKQYMDGNTVYDDLSNNSAGTLNSGNNAQGNIGVNIASGGLNGQANDAAISKGSEGETTETYTVDTIFGEKEVEKTYESMVFAKAATFSIQSSSNNSYDNDGTTNSAGASDSFNTASGNLGVNMAAGFGNGQHNGMTLAVGQNSSAEATVAGVQTVYGNELDNDVACGCTVNTNTASLTNSFNNATGNVGVNIAAGNANLQSNTLSIARAQ
ncbi:hypothetical protein FIU83_13675 [Halomonas sp. THAF5a]|uniref:hypothetical protein n=1 Tax=Halomonas sp. THAF5a TaxID=2587844 RepID=UPI00126970D4|nr:hypothetical protein [Halomonas sp. THAF5a]QFU02688.1 hypothetical protein FIU83_13675 [Halomonas sp. THAF5a]